MMHPTFDADGYPTEETLQAIRDWPWADLHGLFVFIREAWHWEHYWKQRGGTVRVATGGWSGNEDLIGALQDNHAAWGTCWQSSSRGGGYVFKVPR